MNKQFKKHIIILVVALVCSLGLSTKTTALVESPYLAFQSLLQAAPLQDTIMREGLAYWWSLFPESELKNRLAKQYELKYYVSPARVQLSAGSIQDCLDREAEHERTNAKLNRTNQELNQNLTSAQKACQQAHETLTTAHEAEKNELNTHIDNCTDAYNKQAKQLFNAQSEATSCQKSLGEEQAAVKELRRQLEKALEEGKAYQQTAQGNQTQHETCLAERETYQRDLDREKIISEDLAGLLKQAQAESLGHQQTAQENKANHEKCVANSEIYQRDLEQEKAVSQDLRDLLEQAKGESSGHQQDAQDAKTKHGACLTDMGNCQSNLQQEKATSLSLREQLEQAQRESRGHQDAATQNKTNHETCISENKNINSALGTCQTELGRTQTAQEASQKELNELREANKKLEQENRDIRELCNDKKILAVYDANAVFIEKNKLFESAFVRAEETDAQKVGAQVFAQLIETARQAQQEAESAAEKLNEAIAALIPDVENGIQARASIKAPYVKGLDRLTKTLNALKQSIS